MNPRRITVTLGSAAGGLLAAAFLQMAVAAADQYVYEPDGSSFVQLQNPDFTVSPISLPPLFDQETGYEAFSVVDTTAGTTSPGALGGFALITDFLGATETQFDENSFVSAPGVLDKGSEITLWQLPGDWGNELIFSSSVPLGLEDIVLTPFGDFPL